MAKYTKLTELTQERQYVSEDTIEELIEVKETVSLSLNSCLIVITPNCFQSPNENHGDNEPLPRCKRKIFWMCHVIVIKKELGTQFFFLKMSLFR